MSQDHFSKILRQLDEIANITPTSVRHGLNKQQRGVPQLPAEFQPGQISVLSNKSDPEHPARKFFVGAESRGDDMQDTGEPHFVALVTRDKRPKVQRSREAMPFAKALALAQRLAQSSKFARRPFVTIYPQGEGKPSAEELLSRFKNIAEDETQVTNESRADEDVLSNIKKRLGDYLADVAQAIKKGDVLSDKTTDSRDLKAVKTITTADGKVIQIRGNDDDGFRISVRDRVSETVFRTISEAETAVRLYQSRGASGTKDYMEER